MAEEKVVFSVKKPTPMWATWVFRIVFCLTTAATIIIAGDTDIADALKVKLTLYLKAADFVIWFMGRGIGVKKSDFEDETK